MLQPVWIATANDAARIPSDSQRVNLYEIEAPDRKAPRGSHNRST